MWIIFYTILVFTPKMYYFAKQKFTPKSQKGRAKLWPPKKASRPILLEILIQSRVSQVKAICATNPNVKKLKNTFG